MSTHSAYSVPTNSQSYVKDDKVADCRSECKKESGDRPTIQLSLPVDQEIEIKTAWKRTSNAIKAHALELLCSVLSTCFEINDTAMPNLSRYLNSCVELCWKMGMQEKPLHLDVEEEKDYRSNMMFDTERFKAYTKIGKNVEYIVWPALLLYEGGQILSKGVAQGC